MKTLLLDLVFNTTGVRTTEKGLPEIELGASLYGPGTVSMHRVVSGVHHDHI